MNKEVSLTTFISSWIVAIYIWNRNYKYDKWYSLFLFTFSSIQFWEFLLWMYKGTKYDYPISGIIIPITLCLELIVPYIGKLWYENNYKWNIGEKLWNDMKSSLFPFILVIYLIFFIKNIVKKEKEYTSITPQGRLNWNNTFETTKNTYIYGFIFAFLLSYPFKNSSMYIPLFLFASVLIALAVSDSFSSYWCLIANFSTFFFLMYPYLP